ncbi:Uncharacterised protein [Mycobacteroides abscessus subsp. abscessus]|nr:Uncharacterised protein [Mycobacteroides abscessus subsp. abscessus]
MYLRAVLDLRGLGIDDGVELAQRAPVAAPVLGQVGRHHVCSQQQVGDAEQATVLAVLPGVGVLALLVVVRRDAELGNFGDPVLMQHRVLAREDQSHGPVQQHRPGAAHVLLQ